MFLSNEFYFEVQLWRRRVSLADTVWRLSSSRVMIPVSFAAGLPERLCGECEWMYPIAPAEKSKGGRASPESWEEEKEEEWPTRQQSWRRKGREKSKEEWRTEIYNQPEGEQGATTWRKRKNG